MPDEFDWAIDTAKKLNSSAASFPTGSLGRHVEVPSQPQPSPSESTQLDAADALALGAAASFPTGSLGRHVEVPSQPQPSPSESTQLDAADALALGAGASTTRHDALFSQPQPSPSKSESALAHDGVAKEVPGARTSREAIIESSERMTPNVVRQRRFFVRFGDFEWSLVKSGIFLRSLSLSCWRTIPPNVAESPIGLPSPRKGSRLPTGLGPETHDK